MSSNDSVRPFRIDIPGESLQELRRRVAVPRWPDRETVSDRTQGAQLAKVQELVGYWATDYDWRKREHQVATIHHHDEKTLLAFARPRKPRRPTGARLRRRGTGHRGDRRRRHRRRCAR